MYNIFVVNKANHSPTNNDFYIGRGSVLGNPYTSKKLDNTKALYQCSSKEESIERYEVYLRDKIESGDIVIMNEINYMLKHLKTSDINLVCYCKPNDCHGDVIKSYLLSTQINEVMKKLIKK